MLTRPHSLTLKFIVALFLGASAGVGQIWLHLVPSSSPTTYGSPRMAFDSLRGRAVVFESSTWEWDGSNWAMVTPTAGAPSARAEHAMAFDSIRGRTVLFGGSNSSTVFGDTWEWDGATWTQMNPAASPSPRTNTAMAFDSQRGRTVLFGGWNFLVQTGDTWEWDGVIWTPRLSVQYPPARCKHVMTYDSTRGRTVLFGGATAVQLDDTWEWDGAAWVQRFPSSSPPGRWGPAAAAFDSVNSVTVLFGGVDGGVGQNDTWLWDGTDWTQQLPPASPSPRADGAVAYDSSRGNLVLFGGSGSSGTLSDTWAWGPVTATASTFGAGCGQPALTATPTTGSSPVVGTTSLTDITNAPAGVAFMAIGLSRTTVGPFALPFPLAPFGSPGCFIYHDAIDLGEPCGSSPLPGVVQYALPIPNNLRLAGFKVYLQAWAPAPGVNPAALITSNAIELMVGTQ